MEEMMKLYAMSGDGGFSYPVEVSLVVNTASNLIKKLDEYIEKDPDKAEKIASYIYKLSLISQRKLSAEEMKSFLEDGFSILSMI